MSKTEHTPGPWEIGRNDGFSVPINAEKQLAFDLATAHNGGNDREALANARLIAACPDLLAACQALPLAKFADEANLDAADFVDYCTNFLEAMRLARAAIAKATGGTQ